VPNAPRVKFLANLKNDADTAMSFYRNHVYPYLVSALGNPKPIEDIRRSIVPLARGSVLEIGAGPGVNFAHYDPVSVTKVYALEPNPGMLRRAEEQRRRTHVQIEFLDLPGERIPLGDSSVDTVVSTFTLCTIPGVVEAIEGVRRVLKPDGKLIFFEHGLSPDPVGSKYSSEPQLSRCPALVVLKETAQSLLASHRSPTAPLGGAPRQGKQ